MQARVQQPGYTLSRELMQSLYSSIGELYHREVEVGIIILEDLDLGHGLEGIYRKQSAGALDRAKRGY
jgi:hypothetical protein